MLVGITGANGFIGRHLTDFFSSQPGVRIRRFDRKKEDLFDIPSLNNFVKGLDVVIHAAGANRAENADMIRVNLTGTSNLLDAIKLYGRPDKTRFIFLSSFQVYSPLAEKVPVSEEVAPAPRTLFGITKRAAEDLLRISGIKGAVVRLSNVYGPLCLPFYNSVVSTFCELARNEKEIMVNGDGNQARDFIFIDDVVSALAKLICVTASEMKILNLCGGRLSSLNDIILEIETISQKRLKVVYNKNDEPARFLMGDNSKIKGLIDWDAATTFPEGIKQTYRWFEGRP